MPQKGSLFTPAGMTKEVLEEAGYCTAAEGKSFEARPKPEDLCVVVWPRD